MIAGISDLSHIECNLQSCYIIANGMCGISIPYKVVSMYLTIHDILIQVGRTLLDHKLKYQASQLTGYGMSHIDDCITYLI